MTGVLVVNPDPVPSLFCVHRLQDDSIDGIYDTLKTCACISKYAGGIGLSIHNIRATDSYIRGTNGSSNGLVPMLRVYSDTARYVMQRSGRAGRRVWVQCRVAMFLFPVCVA